MDKKYIIWGVVVAVVIVAAFLVSQLKTIAPPGVEEGEKGFLGLGNGDEIPFADKFLDLKISRDGFTPAKFRARKSDQLHITLINEDKEFHNTFKFEDLPFDAIVPNGGKTTFTVIVPSESGEYVFFTDVGTIRKGTLIVEK